MKTMALLICGSVLLVVGITFHINASKWAMVVISQQPNAVISQANGYAQEAYTYIGEQLKVLGIILISIGVFSWIKNPATKV